MLEIAFGQRASVAIPNHFVFVWIGASLPAYASIAIRSALQSNWGSRATLYHERKLLPDLEIEALKGCGLQLESIDVEQLLLDSRELAPSLDTARLSQLYFRLQAPAAQANFVRLLILYSRGGIYLSTGSLTLRDLKPLRGYGAFCAQERILWPSKEHITPLKSLTLDEIQRFCAVVPYAYRMNRKLSTSYSVSSSNAVLGANRGHPFILSLLDSISGLSEQRLTRRNALGSELLDAQLGHFRPGSDTREEVYVAGPDCFAPLGPETSRHFFAHYRCARMVATELVASDTFVINWYATPAQLNKRSKSFIVKNAAHELFSYLCLPYVQFAAEPRDTVIRLRLADAESGKSERRSLVAMV